MLETAEGTGNSGEIRSCTYFEGILSISSQGFRDATRTRQHRFCRVLATDTQPESDHKK